MVTNISLVVNTRRKKNQSIVTMGRKDKDNQIAQALLMIYQHNPRALVGYTPENASAYKQLLKAEHI